MNDGTERRALHLGDVFVDVHPELTHLSQKIWTELLRLDQAVNSNTRAATSPARWGAMRWVEINISSRFVQPEYSLRSKCCCPLIPLVVSVDHASGRIAVMLVQKEIESRIRRVGRGCVSVTSRRRDGRQFC